MTETLEEKQAAEKIGKRKETRRKWYAANSKKVIKQIQDWRIANPEKHEAILNRLYEKSLCYPPTTTRKTDLGDLVSGLKKAREKKNE